MTAALLQVEGLSVSFAGRAGRRRQAPLRALSDVSFALEAGQTLGVVGESGCGKSTLARAILHLIAPSAGQVRWQGRDQAGLSTTELRHCRRQMQIVFQDPLAALNPRFTAGEIIAEPLRNFEPALDRAGRAARVAAAMRQVGLTPALVNRYPHEFSGGQCQRLGIARAVVLRPQLLVWDEPVSALDVSIQAQIIELLAQLQGELDLALIFISHDLAVVRHVSQRVLVLYLGRVMELAERTTLFANPRHPYTRALLAAAPVPDPQQQRQRRTVLGGEAPSPLDPPSGCPFESRCAEAEALCARKLPQLIEASPGHFVACHKWLATSGLPQSDLNGAR
ncbi:MAG: ATP-binding cassette domain-containing protein [Alphaproteobacteria bacterium]|nr:ATP-binding cassette domain-containing protein [Alphaproteobacteria bacterium]MDP7426992.1 ATP-binding cassette domain-containing protein [Alphaproteobacteria bacterium]